MRMTFLTLITILTLAVTSAGAQEDHSQHQAAPATNAGASNDGPWSYKGRKNPDPHTRNRWEMVPAEGNSATYVAADKLTKQQRCAALKRQNVQALDRATRAECGISATDATAQGGATRSETPATVKEGAAPAGNTESHQH